MEQNTDRMYWTIGIIVIAAMVLLGTLNLVDAQVLPTIKDKIFNVFNNDKADDTKAIKGLRTRNLVFIILIHPMHSVPYQALPIAVMEK